MALQETHKNAFNRRVLNCPLRGQWVSFRLVDEFGKGHTYGGLAYKVSDSAGQEYSGILDAEGYAKLENCYKGPVVVTFDDHHDHSNTFYSGLMVRKFYPLPITELQVRAEETRFFHQDGVRVEHNPAQKDADEFVQVEVRDLVKHAAHLPPVAKRFYPLMPSVSKAMGELGFGPEETFGIALTPNKHTVLEVRPLRALRPMLSTDNEFCALNLYQLALISTLSYSDFGQKPPQRPMDKVSFPFDPSFGNLFGDALAGHREAWRVSPDQSDRYHPLYEDVPYSKRFEILPFDPTIYKENRPELEEKQEHPANQHFFSDQTFKGTDTQAFITHHDEVVLITVRGTKETWDFWRDADALQVPFEEGVGKAHRGFYLAYQAIHEFIQDYLSRFYSGQKIIICGHSLGGAITTLLAEALRRSTKQKYDVLLYTYGSPRAGDSTFVEGAAGLAHHRMVNNNDPIPSVPSPWMDADRSIWGAGAIMGLSNPYGWLVFVAGSVNIRGDQYQHHGKQQHFMPVQLSEGPVTSVLWDPGCDSIEHAAVCKLAEKQYARDKYKHDMPERGGFIKQLMSMDDHFMVPSYVPFAWATLRRWQQTHGAGRTVITDREHRFIHRAIESLDADIQSKAKRLRSSTDSARRIEDSDINNVISRLEAERRRLYLAHERLLMLVVTKIEPVDIYGNALQSGDFASCVKRWMAHQENNANVQLAMIPPKPDLVYIAGAYYPTDCDPMV